MDLGDLKEIKEDDNIELYHIHTMKSHDQQEWKIGETMDTKFFSRQPSYNYPKRFRENVFEKVRKETFDHMPSRTNCLFLSPSLETTKEWYNILGGEKQVLKIKLIKGKYVFVDEEIYSNEDISNQGMNNDAFSYWDGDGYLDSKKISVLFDGVFKVVEEIKL